MYTACETSRVVSWSSVLALGLCVSGSSLPDNRGLEIVFILGQGQNGLKKGSEKQKRTQKKGPKNKKVAEIGTAM